MTLIRDQYVKRGYLPVGMLLYWYDGTLNMDDAELAQHVRQRVSEVRFYGNYGICSYPYRGSSLRPEAASH